MRRTLTDQGGALKTPHLLQQRWQSVCSTLYILPCDSPGL
jgi:hypothetical protein